MTGRLHELGDPIPPGYDPRLDESIAYPYDHPNGHCSRCGLSWKRVPHHSTWISKTQAVFVLCEACWAELPPVDRLPHYRVWFDQIAFDHRRRGGAEPFDRLWPTYETAVLGGA
jgi:hypothetical protein